MSASGPYSVEDWQVEAFADLQNPVYKTVTHGKWVSNKTLEGFERAANIVTELENYVDKFYVPPSIKEIKKILGREI